MKLKLNFYYLCKFIINIKSKQVNILTFANNILKTMNRFVVTSLPPRSYSYMTLILCKDLQIGYYIYRVIRLLYVTKLRFLCDNPRDKGREECLGKRGEITV